MAVVRQNPYSAFNFLVALGESNGVVGDYGGGFSDATVGGATIAYANYRNGNEPDNYVRKVAGLTTTKDVTLKRGVIGDLRLFAWLQATSRGEHEPRTVTISLLDEAHRDTVCTWTLLYAQPSGWDGPSLTAATASTVAMETLTLVAHEITYT